MHGGSCMAWLGGVAHPARWPNSNLQQPAQSRYCTFEYFLGPEARVRHDGVRLSATQRTRVWGRGSTTSSSSSTESLMQTSARLRKAKQASAHVTPEPQCLESLYGLACIRSPPPLVRPCWLAASDWLGHGWFGCEGGVWAAKVQTT
ncbi:hypothetical protein IF2G_04615 [Cordyceps javanica]|nr:hypothetical protein IF2G_04615 [Cordyceps javanica]